MQTAPLTSVDPLTLTGKENLDPSLVVSIHDVSTVTRERVVGMLKDLKAVGVTVTSLLVIPDHHHKGRIDSDLTFGEWIREVTGKGQGGGHEAVLHGFFHIRTTKQGEGLTTKIITRSYTAGEGEFHDLTRDDASSLLLKGKEAFAACGITPTGFIAPAWLLGKEAEVAVREMGFDYTTRIGEVIDCKEGRSFPSRSMVYSVRARWRREVSLLWNELLAHHLKSAPLLRIGLHPPDWDHQSIRDHALSCIRKAIETRRVTTYARWLDQWRSSGH
jgi:predicted deacetylase